MAGSEDAAKAQLSPHGTSAQDRSINGIDVSSNFPFFTLLPELRTIVYEHLFSDVEVSLCRYREKIAIMSINHRPTLFFVLKDAEYDEARRVFWNSARVEYSVDESLLEGKIRLDSNDDWICPYGLLFKGVPYLWRRRDELSSDHLECIKSLWQDLKSTPYRAQFCQPRELGLFPALKRLYLTGPHIMWDTAGLGSIEMARDEDLVTRIMNIVDVKIHPAVMLLTNTHAYGHLSQILWRP